MGNLNDIKKERMRKVERVLIKPMSCYEVAKELGYPKPTVKTYLEEMYDRGRVHIGGWRIAERAMTKLYLAGEGEDVAKPCRGTKPDDDEIFQRPPVVVQIRRDPLVAALFGESA